jgi:hypothetical protein
MEMLFVVCCRSSSSCFALFKPNNNINYVLQYIYISFMQGQSLTPGPYYTFPSGYSYRQDALLNHLLPHLPMPKKLRVLELCSLLGQPLTPATLTYIKRNKIAPPSLKLKSTYVGKGLYGGSSGSGAGGGGGSSSGGGGGGGGSLSNSSHSMTSSAHGSLDLKAGASGLAAAAVALSQSAHHVGGGGASNSNTNASPLPIVSPTLSQAERLAYQQQLDDIIAAECPLTGNIAIDLVDQPLLTKEDLEAERSGWEI